MPDIAAPANSLPRQSELEDLAGLALDAARRLGASAAEAAVSHDSGLSLTVRLGEVETLEHHRNRGIAVTVYFGTRKGSASTADWRPVAVEETVKAACAIAAHTAEDPCAGLADTDRLAREIPDLDLYHPWDLTPAEATDRARACEAAARGLDARIANSEGATVTTHRSLMVYANSGGFRGGYPTTRHSLACSVIARDDGGMQRDHWYTLARDATALETPEAVGRRAARRALQRLGSRRLATREAPVLFVPELARGLVGHFVGAIRGAALYRQASFLVDALGRQVFPETFGIREEPHLPGALGSAPFDAEGVATTARDLVDGGVLRGYLLDSYAARRLGMETTGNAGGAHNLVVAPMGPDPEALLAELGGGLVVTHLMGHGVNLLTGHYSRGAAGFWVAGDGERHPVEEITVAGDLGTMFRGIRAVGGDVDARGGIRCGSILVERMTVAGE